MRFELHIGKYLDTLDDETLVQSGHETERDHADYYIAQFRTWLEEHSTTYLGPVDEHHQLCVYEVQYAYPSGSTESPLAATGIQWVVTSSPKRAAEFAIELNGDHILVTDVHYVRNYNVED